MRVHPARFILRAALLAALAFVFLPTVRLVAQRPAEAVEAPGAKIGAGGKKVLTLADYGPWKRIAAASISDDGKWMTYSYAPNDGDDTLFVKQLDGDTLYTINTGSAGGGRGGGRGGGGGGGAQFSSDAKFAAYFVNPPASTGRGRGGAAPGGGGGRGAQGGGQGAQGTRGGGAPGVAGANAASPENQRKLEILNLTTGEKYDVPNASGFQFSKDSQWVGIKMDGTAGDASHRGTDLILRRLSTGSNQNIGNVYQYDFDDSGKWLAYSVDATNHMGNGIYVLNPATGETRTLDGAPVEYDSLLWRADSTGLLALRGEKPKGKELKENSLLVWADASASQPVKTEWDASKDTTMPAGFVLSEFTAPRWSKDGSKVVVSIKAQADTVAPGNADDQANLDIWHWKDADLQSEQMIRIAQLRRATFSSVFHVASKKFVRLADDTMPTVTFTSDDNWAIGSSAAPYELDFSEGAPSRADYYAINTTTGAKTLIARHLLRTIGASPDGKWFLYIENGHVTAHNIETGTNTVIDAATGKSFLNVDDDHAAEKPIYGLAGWAKDGKSVLLYDKYDIWSLPLDGSKGAMITAGAGAKDSNVLRLAAGLGAGPAAGGGGGGRFGGAGGNTIDLSQPQTVTAYGDWTKKSGYMRVPANGGAPTPLIFADKSIGGAVKAKNADRVIFTEQTFQEFPDYWVSDASFASPKKVTDANPQITDFAWGSKKLIDYTNSKGKRLQGTLTLPAGYEPGKKYPMLVYIYEIMSNTHHQFSMPVYDDRPHMSAYASDGYLVFQPDIVYDIGKPGTSAVDCVLAGVKEVIKEGFADPAHIGLQGHSWGGYESSFILTQTNMFAAVVTGAPLTNLISMYGEIYKQSGQWNGGILETSQGRMGANVTPWNAHDVYERESPIFHVTNIHTPFLILQGTADGAVDWDQGLEFYNAARKNGKQVIFLSYPDEPHHLAKTPNQKDFQIRMKQFFDHYLKGMPETDWMKNGLPQTKKGSPIK